MSNAANAVPMGLLAADEPPPCELVAGASRRPVIIVCDHASNLVPLALGTLGLSQCRFEDHIAWDIGAAAVARRLLSWFDASGVLAGYSRLVVDLNRSLSDSGAFPALSDGVVVPGNVGLAAGSKAERAATLYHPYHSAIGRLVAEQATADCVPVFISIHSFTPRQHGIERPWHIGVLWDKDPRLPLALLQSLRGHGDLVVADNEPYSGRHSADYTIDHQAEPLGLAHASIEIRQDLIRDEQGQERVATCLAESLRHVLQRDEMYDPALSWLRRPLP